MCSSPWCNYPIESTAGVNYNSEVPSQNLSETIGGNAYTHTPTPTQCLSHTQSIKSVLLPVFH